MRGSKGVLREFGCENGLELDTFTKIDEMRTHKRYYILKVERK